MPKINHVSSQNFHTAFYILILMYFYNTLSLSKDRLGLYMLFFAEIYVFNYWFTLHYYERKYRNKESAEMN